MVYSHILNTYKPRPLHMSIFLPPPAVTEALLVNGAAFRNFAGASIFSDKDKAMNASSMEHIKGKKPPFLIMHGSSDTLISPWQSVELYKGLVEGGNQAEYILLEGVEHGDAHWYQPEIFKIVVDHLRKTLGNEPKKTGDKGNPNTDVSKRYKQACTAHCFTFLNFFIY